MQNRCENSDENDMSYKSKRKLKTRSEEKARKTDKKLQAVISIANANYKITRNIEHKRKYITTNSH